MRQNGYFNDSNVCKRRLLGALLSHFGCAIILTTNQCLNEKKRFWRVSGYEKNIGNCPLPVHGGDDARFLAQAATALLPSRNGSDNSSQGGASGEGFDTIPVKMNCTLYR